MTANISRAHQGRSIAIVGFVALAVAFSAVRLCAESGDSENDTPKSRVAVLSVFDEPKESTSQGLYIKILREAGFDARAISAEELRESKLDGFDIFVIGGGSGTAFNKSLGPEGGKVIQEFVRKGGGALASCAGGYSFVKGQNEALKYIAIAKANVIDADDGRWARGKGEVEIAPADDRYCPLKMFYQNGPLWEIVQEQGDDRTVALARFRSDVKKKDDPGGIMPGTPAILGGTYGRGRFVLFSGHPEFYKKMGNHRLVADAARWVTRGPLKADEPIRWDDVFPNSEKRESATPVPDADDSKKP
jgi:glutamine amidotransferase-like uncharacterized protein